MIENFKERPSFCTEKSPSARRENESIPSGYCQSTYEEVLVSTQMRWEIERRRQKVCDVGPRHILQEREGEREMKGGGKDWYLMETNQTPHLFLSLATSVSHNTFAKRIIFQFQTKTPRVKEKVSLGIAVVSKVFFSIF